MTKIKVYDPKREEQKDKAKEKLLTIYEVMIDLVIYAFILMLASHIFEGFYIENFAYAFLAAAIISGLNATIKPVLIIFTLPITIMSFGLLYPIVNVIVLKLCGLFLYPNFIVEGIIGPFVLVLFISILKIILDELVLKKIKERR